MGRHKHIIGLTLCLALGKLLFAPVNVRLSKESQATLQNLVGCERISILFLLVMMRAAKLNVTRADYRVHVLT